MIAIDLGPSKMDRKKSTDRGVGGIERGLRRILCVCLVFAVYLFSNFVHGPCNIVDGLSSDSTCRSYQDTDVPDVAPPELHCHGCFAASLPFAGDGLADVSFVEFSRGWFSESTEGVVPPPHMPPPRRRR